MRERGVTLIEMMIVVGIVGLIAGIAFPSVESGLATVRLRSSADEVAALLNKAGNWCERRQAPVEVIVSMGSNSITVAATGVTRRLEMSSGVRIAGVLPEVPGSGEADRRFVVLPGGAVPRMGVNLVNARGQHRRVFLDPISGVPEIK